MSSERSSLEIGLTPEPTDAQDWLRLAEDLDGQGHAAAALDACRRAIALWPDIGPAYVLQWRLAQRQDDPELAVTALRAMLRIRPDDPAMNSELGAALSRGGDFAAAVPFLRQAAPIMGHENATLWNYTVALAITGGYDELLESQPLLDRLSAAVAGAYPPFAHLAVAKLSRSFDRQAVTGMVADIEASSRWLRTETVLGRLGKAIAMHEPLSIVRMDYSLARFCCYISLHAHRVLRPRELSAVVNSVWEDWFGDPAETLGVLALSGIERAFSDGLATADIVGLPNAAELRREHYHFGFLAEMLKALPQGVTQAYSNSDIARLMHESVPFLRPLLSGLPFLGVIGRHPTLASRLGRFYGIEDVRAIIIPDEASKPIVPDGMAMSGYLPERHHQVLDALSVPYPGAVFLISAPGPLGIAYCGHVRAHGGIAVDIGALADDWA